MKQNITNRISSGFTQIDRDYFCCSKGELIILAKQPGMGMFSFAVQLLKNISIDQQIPVGIISTSYTPEYWIKKLMSLESGIPFSQFKNGNFTPYEWKILNKTITKIQKAPFYIQNTQCLRMEDLITKVTELKSKHDISLILIDNLEQIKLSHPETQLDREERINRINRKLRAIALKLNIVVATLYEMPEKPEKKRKNVEVARPSVKDLDVCSVIKHANTICFMYRPEYYGFRTRENGTSTENIAELILTKVNGETKIIPLNFYPQTGKFREKTERTHPNNMSF